MLVRLAVEAVIASEQEKLRQQESAATSEEKKEASSDLDNIDDSIKSFVSELFKRKDLPSLIELGLDSYHSMVYLLASEIYNFCETKSGQKTLNEIELILLSKMECNIKIVGMGCISSGLHIARSKYNILLCGSCHISFVIPIYDEISRFKPYDINNNRHGQNFLYRKLEQLNWICQWNKNITYNFIIVDDGCPKNSGKFIDSKIRENPNLYKNCKVYWLQNIIDDSNDLIFKDMKSAKTDSRKGGAVVYGLYIASNESDKYIEEKEKEKKEHLICYTDCDLSCDLGMIGTLIYGLKKDKSIELSMGSRYGTKGSVLAYKGGEVVDSLNQYNGINRTRVMVRYILRSLLIPSLNGIKDTNFAFKLFRAKTLKKIIKNIKDRSPSFDAELLLLLFNNIDNIQCKDIFPVYFVEDFDASQFSKQEEPATYFYPMITKTLLIYYDIYIKNKMPINFDKKNDDRTKTYQLIQNLKDKQIFDKLFQNLDKKYPKSTHFFGQPFTLKHILNAMPKQ